MSDQLIALKHQLLPLQVFLEDASVSEICINQPYEVFVEKKGNMLRYEVPELSLCHLEGIVRLVAAYENVSSQHALLGVSLPSGERLQIAQPPACERGCIALSIRKVAVSDLCFDDYLKKGAFDHVQYIHFSAQEVKPCTAMDKQLLTLLDEKNWKAFFKKAVQCKKNIIICGGTGTGKTTFLNVLSDFIPLHERLITVEDKREVQVNHSNVIHLLGSADTQAQVSTNALVRACLRLRPDRVLMGELRGAEAFSWMNITASGHEGTLATVHASSIEHCFNRLVMMVKQAPEAVGMSQEEIRSFLMSLIDIVVQFSDRSLGRYFSEIYFSNAPQGKRAWKK